MTFKSPIPVSNSRQGPYRRRKEKNCSAESKITACPECILLESSVHKGLGWLMVSKISAVELVCRFCDMRAGIYSAICVFKRACVWYAPESKKKFLCDRLSFVRGF